MEEINDLVVSQMLVKKGRLTMETLQQCLQMQKSYSQQGRDKSLENILIEQNLVSREEIVQVRNSLILEREISIPGYLFIKKLGEGGMGAVYKGIQLSLERPVAIKLLDPKLGNDPTFVQRFVHEARILAQLSHSNIVRGIDFGESDGLYYYVMEYFEGQDVNELVETRQSLDETNTLSILLQIARALKYIHQKRLVHRDIKPDNILVCKDGTAKLCDLGLAKWETNTLSLTQEGSVVGTPYYLSPEQAKGEIDVDIRSDIYSLGATTYFMLTGKPPYEGERATVVYYRHIYDPPPTVTNLCPNLSKWWDTFFAKIMSKDIEKRFQTPQELIQFIEEYQLNPSSPSEIRTPSDVKSTSQKEPSKTNKKVREVTSTSIRKKTQISKKTDIYLQNSSKAKTPRPKRKKTPIPKSKKTPLPTSKGGEELQKRTRRIAKQDISGKTSRIKREGSARTTQSLRKMPSKKNRQKFVLNLLGVLMLLLIGICALLILFYH